MSKKPKDEGRLVRASRSRLGQANAGPMPDYLKMLCESVAEKKREGVPAAQIAAEEGLRVPSVWDVNLAFRKQRGASVEEIAKSENMTIEAVKVVLDDYDRVAKRREVKE